MKIVPPCKKDGIQCDKRFLGCQSKCQEFIEYRKKLDEKNRIIRQAKEANNVLYAYNKNKVIGLQSGKLRKHKTSK